MKLKKILSNQNVIKGVERSLFVFGLIFLSLLYGMMACHYRLFPYYQVLQACNTWYEAWPKTKSQIWYYVPTQAKRIVPRVDSRKMAPGLTKIVSIDADYDLSVKVVDAYGEIVQHWRIEWFDVWPQAPAYLTKSETPKTRPGTHVHGAQILSNGDLVFNFEHLGLVRMTPCGKVVWRLEFRTHHSIFVDDEENLWVSAQLNHAKPSEKYPLYEEGYIEPIILQVSPDGKILQQRSVFDLLKQNNLEGAIYSTSTDDPRPIIRGNKIILADTLHLNDVEVFSRNKKPGFFKPGDIMVSLRNINMVLVFDSDWKLKYSVSHEFVRQHDPDFMDGSRISVYDNHNTLPRPYSGCSRIVIKSADTGDLEVIFRGTAERPFFSDIMGKHQWLDNGNLLVSETRNGRALEISPEGETVWEINNIVEPGWAGIIEEAERLPERYNKDFFVTSRSRCK